jgi:1-acyl-sn-glycerol-3-phosphate acyltransferase
MSIVVFPEGRRTDDGHIHPFKHGAFRLAKEFDLPIVPITINGSYKVMSRTMFHVQPGIITLTIHEPIAPEQFGDTIQELTQKSFDAVTSSLEES